MGITNFHSFLFSSFFLFVFSSSSFFFFPYKEIFQKGVGGDVFRCWGRRSFRAAQQRKSCKKSDCISRSASCFSVRFLHIIFIFSDVFSVCDRPWKNSREKILIRCFDRKINYFQTCSLLTKGASFQEKGASSDLEVA